MPLHAPVFPGRSRRRESHYLSKIEILFLFVPDFCNQQVYLFCFGAKNINLRKKSYLFKKKVY